MLLINLKYVSAAVILTLAIALTIAAQTQTDIVGPAGSGSFGETVTALPNGNFVVTDATYNAGAVMYVGAVHLYSGSTNTIIATLTGSTSFDRVGGFGIQVLSNGDFVVMSPYWINGAANEAGAVTLCSATTGCPGVVSAANSLVGTSDGDHVGIGGVTALPGGKYVVDSYDWSSDGGAVTFCLATGCTGSVTTANSLYGSSGNVDEVGFYQIVVLANGDYVVSSIYYGPLQNGAVTLCSGTTGCVGTVSANNSLIGANFFDNIGSSGIIALPTGDYVVGSGNAQVGAVSQAGAVTRCSGTAGCPSTITSMNSLVGTATADYVGGPVLLTDGNYVVLSSNWSSARGAATWCSSTAACIGPVTTANSLVGTVPNSLVSIGGIYPLPGGKYLVSSPNWDSPTMNAGAVTFCPTPAACSNVAVSAANSLVGSVASDSVGGSAIAILTNGNYVVGSPGWNNGAVANVGAATFCSGTSGCTGAVTAANSLIGTSANDMVGLGGGALTNGNYVVRSPNWDNGATADVGAATWCNGSTGCAGTTVSTANSLVGTTASDTVGIGGIPSLPNGNYVVLSSGWDNGALVNAGAVTYGIGAFGSTGNVSAANSVVGQAANSGFQQSYSYDATHNQLIVGRGLENIVTLFKFAPTAAAVSISGRVTNGLSGVYNATVRLSDDHGKTLTVATSPFGYFRFDGIESGRSYLISVRSKRASSTPRLISVADDISDIEIDIGQ